MTGSEIPDPHAEPGSDTPPVNGDKVRDTWFLRSSIWHVDGHGGGFIGYAASEVDDLLRRVGAELDAGRPAGPLIENATFQRKLISRRYDIDAVDWFLHELLRRLTPSDRAGMGADPWRDLPVAQLTQRGTRSFSQECSKAWNDFGQQPGTYLSMEHVNVRRRGWELRTGEQQALASQRGGFASDKPISVGGRSFTFTRPGVSTASLLSSEALDIMEFAASSWRDHFGNFAAKTMTSSEQHGETWTVRGLVDETGTPVLYTSGKTYDRRAYGRVTFPDGRWLRFLVRGTKDANLIMTAVDQAGNRVARYRIGPSPKRAIEITVHPGWKLTDELVLTIAISMGGFLSYFVTGGGGS